MEIVGTEWRDVSTALFQVPFILGHMSLPLFAYLLRNWRDLQLAISVPSVVLISYFWVIPESPRWLFTVGRINDAAKVLEKVAAFNKRSAETIKLDLEMQHNITSATEPKSRSGFFDLVRTPNMRRNTLCMWFNWLSCGMGFYGVAQYIGQSGGNKFVNVAISAAIGIPGMIICLIGMRKVGRKWTLIMSKALTGVCMLIIIAYPSQQVIFASIALVGLNIAFTVVYVFAGELIPTVVRSVGVGTGNFHQLYFQFFIFCAIFRSVSHFTLCYSFGTCSCRFDGSTIYNFTEGHEHYLSTHHIWHFLTFRCIFSFFPAGNYWVTFFVVFTICRHFSN